MTDMRPGITFNEEGICYPCIHFEKEEKREWSKRWRELAALCDKHRRDDDYYDCIITVSGGKDSTRQVGLFKEELGMNPLCLMVDNGSWTDTGRMNFYNLSEQFGVDILKLTLNRKVSKILAVKGFVEELKPNLYWDRALYVWPLQIALKLGIKLVIWGENVNITHGGPEGTKETPDAMLNLRCGMMEPDNECLKEWCVEGITMKDLQPCIIPSKEELLSLEVIYSSYFIRWSRFKNTEYARAHGFKTLEDTGEWIRKGMEDFPFEQVDTVGYIVNQYCKFIKFGFSDKTELYSDMIRHQLISREDALEKVDETDWQLDPIMLEDFCKGLGITEDYFWEVIESFVNRDLLEFKDGWWKPKRETE